MGNGRIIVVLASMGIGVLGVHAAACSDDTTVTPASTSDGSTPGDATGDATGTDAGLEAAADAAFCAVGVVTGSCEQTASMGPSLYTRFCSDLIATSRCVESSSGQGSGTSTGSKVAACPTDASLLGRCAYSTPCRNDVNEYAYALPGNPNNTVEKASAACAAAGGTWQELTDGGTWVTK